MSQLENDNVINNLFFRNIIAVDYQPLLGTATFELEDYTVKFSGISKYVFVQDYFNMDFKRFIAKYFKGERAKEIEEYGKYVQTKKYAEEVAKEKLGLVYEDEIIFKAED